MKMKVNPVKKIKAEILLPGDKSISHRSIILSSISKSQVKIFNFLDSQDCRKTLEAFKKLGVSIEVKSSNVLLVHGVGLRGLKKPQEEIYLGNSGTSMRLIMGVLAGQSFSVCLSGDKSLSSRPMKRITQPLSMMGAKFEGRNQNDNIYAPITVMGSFLRSINYISPIGSAQVKSAILLAGLYVNDETSVTEPYKSRDHTERMLRNFGIEVKEEGTTVTLIPAEKLQCDVIKIPGDFSSAMPFILAGLIIPCAHITIREVGINPTRTGALRILKRMGAHINIKNETVFSCEPVADIEVKSSLLKGTRITEDMIPSTIDELLLLMVAGCFAEGITEILGASELRVKETDRIESMVSNLKKMGAKIRTEKDDIYIYNSKLKGNVLDSYFDHRTAMALVIAALASQGYTIIKDVECVDVSFPDFFKILRESGVDFSII